MMATILNSAILDSAILHSKKFNLTHSFILTQLMMAAILNSAMLDSDTSILDSNTLLSSLRFTQKHSPFTLNLTHTNSIWLTWWWQPSWILPFWIQPFCTKLWLKLVPSDSNSFILTELDDGSHLEFCHLGFRHLVFFSEIHSKTLSPPLWLWLKLINLTQPQSFSLNLMMAAILNSANLHSAILVFPLKLTHTCQDWFPPFAQKKLHIFILTQLYDGSHLEFCHVGIRHCHLAFRHLVIFSEIYSKTLSLYSESDSN